MKGLKGILIKDISIIKNQLFIVVGIIIFYIAATALSKDTAYVASFAGSYAGSYNVVLMTMLPVTLLGYDEKNKWGRYSAAMPVSRKANVVSKFIVMLGMSAINAVVLGIVFYITGRGDMVTFIIATLGASLFTGSLVTVLAYKFGSNKARCIFIGVLLIAFIFIAYSAKYNFALIGNGISFDIGGIKMIALGFFAFSVLGSLACTLASIRIYENKDL